MTRLFSHLFAALLATTFVACAGAPEAAPSSNARFAVALVPFASEEGLARLARSDTKADFAVLANQFEPQSNGAFCGPTTAAIVLNAVYANSSALPRDRSRLHPNDLVFLSKGADISLPRFSQDNVILAGRKTRAQVLGEPMLINGRRIKDFGYQVRQLDEMLLANGLSTELKVVLDSTPIDAIRVDLKTALRQGARYVIVSFKRSAAAGNGGGHISPLGAYDAASDSVLLLDVNPTAAGWVWMPLITLVAGMRTFDVIENRGYILVQAK